MKRTASKTSKAAPVRGAPASSKKAPSKGAPEQKPKVVEVASSKALVKPSAKSPVPISPTAKADILKSSPKNELSKSEQASPLHKNGHAKNGSTIGSTIATTASPSLSSPSLSAASPSLAAVPSPSLGSETSQPLHSGRAGVLGAGVLGATDSTAGLLAAIADIPDAPPVLQLVDDLTSGRPGPMANASRVLEEWLLKKPEVLVPAIDRLIGCINSPHKRVAQTAALALPVMGRLAPARVARHLPTLTDKFPECSDVAKDGLVATFAALCTASVAYQKRLEPVLDLALSSADPKTLLRWAEVVLPSLKGEPHARARSVVEARLPSMPRPQAQPIATFLGIKLRPLPV